jgi:predicted glycoside hydrolase/deacetylase ChbG (UPF0249 family)
MRTLVQELGFQPGAKLLIVHADDLGIAHAVNAATIEAFRTGLVNSGSAMVPCPWFAEIAGYAKNHPEVDLGIHLTVTSEWNSCRWGPVSSRNKVQSLLDPDGYFHVDWTEKTHVKVREVEHELRAQIERALAMGVRPSHLDSHQFLLYRNGKSLFELVVRLGREYGVPVALSRNWFPSRPYLAQSFGPSVIAADREIHVSHDVPAERWTDFYTDVIRSLLPGVTELVIHVGYDDAELRALAGGCENWGAGWRQRDFDFFTSSVFRKLLQENDIELVTWRDWRRASQEQAESSNRRFPFDARLAFLRE